MIILGGIDDDVRTLVAIHHGSECEDRFGKQSLNLFPDSSGTWYITAVSEVCRKRPQQVFQLSR